MKARKKSTVCTIALPARHAHHGGVVGRMQADQHVVARHRHQRAQRARQHRGADLGAAAAAAHGDRRDRLLRFLLRERQLRPARPASACLLGSIGGKSLKRRMKRRSIQSFQRQTQSPSKPMRAARGDRVLVAGADQRQPAALRPVRRAAAGRARCGAGCRPAAGPCAPRTRRPFPAAGRRSRRCRRRRRCAGRSPTAGGR